MHLQHHLHIQVSNTAVRPTVSEAKIFLGGYRGNIAVINHTEGQALWADSRAHWGSNTPGGHTSELWTNRAELLLPPPSLPSSPLRFQTPDSRPSFYFLYVTSSFPPLSCKGGGLVFSLFSNVLYLPAEFTLCVLAALYTAVSWWETIHTEPSFWSKMPFLNCNHTFISPCSVIGTEYGYNTMPPRNRTLFKKNMILQIL